MTTDALAALLVREGVLPASRVDEAQERVVLLGGTLDTALLELGYLDERPLIDLMSRAYNARAVGPDELKTIDRSVLSLFPRRLADKHGVVPIDVVGRRLTVALAGTPDLALLDEIGFMLSVYVKPAVTTQARVAWGLATHYGIPLAPRMEALLNRIGEKAEVVKAAVDEWQARASHARKPAPSPPAPPVSPPPAQSANDDTSGWAVAQRAGLNRDLPSTPRLEAAGGGSIEARADHGARTEAARGQDEERALRNRRRTERVMWTVDDAIAELALAEERDAMLDVVLRFGYRRLTTVAAFILTRNAPGGGQGASQAFIGWDVIDPLLEREDIAAFALPADGKHALAQVLQMQSPFLGPLKREDPLVRLFGRRARAVILVPLLVGDRFVGVLYGDCGSKSIPPSSLAELHMVVPRLGKGLGNLILRNKKALRAAAAPAPADADLPLLVVGELVAGPASASASAAAAGAAVDEQQEENIAVAAQAPARNLPTIDIDISEILEESPRLEAPSALSSAQAPAANDDGRIGDASGNGNNETGNGSGAPMPWADGMGDDEDVRLDDLAVAALEGPAPRRHDAARIHMGLDDGEPLGELGFGPDGDELNNDDADNSDDVVDARDDAASIPDAPLVSIPDGPMPGPVDASPTPRLPSSLLGSAAPQPLAEAPSVADSPGVRARESLLVATHAGWLAHDDVLLDDLVGRLHRPAEKEQKAAVAAVLSHGARALPSLARYFPGVLAVHPFGSMAHRPEVSELSDCLTCLCKLGADLAAPILVGELASDDRLHRWTAVWSLSALRVPAALPRLAQRIFDPEPSIAGLAIEVLEGYRGEEAFPKVQAQVRDLIRRGDAFEKERAILAAGELRDREALSALADLIGTRPKEIADEARRALVEITKQDFGTAERRWRAWIADNESTPRTRWLIDGLAAKEDEIRKSAQSELNRLTGQYFGYRWDAPRTEREVGVEQWNAWWQTQLGEGAGRWP